MKQEHLGIKRQYESLIKLISNAKNLNQVMSYRKAVAVFNSTHNSPFVMANLENLLITKSIEYNGEPLQNNKERLIHNLQSN
jgi:hypothetical protein